MSENLSPLRKRLMEAARQGLDPYMSEYINSFSEILTAANQTSSRVGEVRSNSLAETESDLKIALLYNDTSLLDVGYGGEELKFKLLGPGALERLGLGPQITVNLSGPADPQLVAALSQGQVNLGFVSDASDGMDQFLSDAGRLIEAGRVIPRPMRMLMYIKGKTPEGKRWWHTVPTAENSLLDVWTVEDEAEANDEATVSESVLNGMSGASLAESGELCLPYVDGVSLDDYAAILDDENDLIVEFRVALKAMVDEAKKDPRRLDEYRLDVVEPRVAKIERQFRKIASSSNLRIGARSVGTMAATLVAFAAAGPLGAALPLAGGANLVANEFAKRKEAIGDLRDDPLFLLWKLRRGR